MSADNIKKSKHQKTHDEKSTNDGNAADDRGNMKYINKKPQ